MRKTLLAILLALALVVIPVGSALAANTADVTVYATPGFISITVDNTTYDFGALLESTTKESATNYFTIDNTSTVITDNTIGVTTNTWSGGVIWAHSDTCTPAANTAGLKANKGGTWGGGDVIVKFSSPDIIANDQAANTDWSFGLKLYAPTSFGDYVQKSIVVRITATGAV